MFGVGTGELAIILFVALVIFGPGKLPEISKALGRSVREFKDAASGIEKTLQSSGSDDEEKKNT